MTTVRYRQESAQSIHTARWSDGSPLCHIRSGKRSLMDSAQATSSAATQPKLALPQFPRPRPAVETAQTKATESNI